MTETFKSHSAADTENIAYNLAAKIKPGDIVALNGGMGAGKTAFTRGFVRFFSPGSRVSSPTFALVNQYKNILHFDMYRIDSGNEEDLLSIGFFDYLGSGNILIIEWFEKIQAFFDEHTVEIDITVTGIDSREITFRRVK